MELQLVSYEQAKTLKELGFPQETDSWNYYDIEGNCTPYLQKGGHKEHCCDAPSLELVAKWLREEKKYDVNISPVWQDVLEEPHRRDYCINITYKGKFVYDGGIPHLVYSTYEKALSTGIDKVIEHLIKNEVITN